MQVPSNIWSILWTCVVAVIVTSIARFLVKGYQVRTRSHKLPGPPHSLIWGTLPVIGEAMGAVPLRMHPHIVFNNIRKKYNLSGVFFMDLWPFEWPMVVLMDPDAGQQVTVKHNLLKSPTLPAFLDDLVGVKSMVCTEGQEWKQWRSIFNPGFSMQHIMSLVPSIVDDGLFWMQNLLDHAESGKVLRLEDATTRLTIDIIGKVSLGHDFQSQKYDNPCVEALREQVHLLPNEGPLNPIRRYLPWLIYRKWRNDRIMKSYIGKILDDRFAEKERQLSGTIKPVKKSKTILDLALDSYLAGEAKEDPKSPSTQPKLDAEFRAGLITQIRTFVFAGHDTTSSTICYALYLLSKRPECLEKIRREHEAILGPVERTAQLIKDSPILLNKLEYTQAVVKESLRLYPAASSVRFGEPGFVIHDPQTGDNYPTEGCLVWLNAYGTHRNEAVWGPTAEAFDPDRFLPANAHKIPDGAFRPFEYGPRNCIGQNLAMLEAKVMLALACRLLDFESALDAVDELSHDGSHYSRNKDFQKGQLSADADEMYQVLIVTGKPREGMPVRTRKANWHA